MSRRSKYRFLLFVLLVLDLILFLLFKTGDKASSPKTATNGNYPEIGELQGKSYNFDQLKKYFTNLANKKGAAYAYDVLKIAPIPPYIDMHLMGHVVGDVLYKQQGINGIKVCTDDFRNACSHSIVVGLLLEKGEGVLPQIAQVCHQAPGGGGAYTMCYHGLGHGILAYTNYDLAKATSLCAKTSKAGASGEEAVQCVGGTIMEIISGGDHDKKTWNMMRPKYLTTTDPFKPCYVSYMPDAARGMCLTYLTPYLFEVAGANLRSPTEKDYANAFKLCGSLNDTSDKDTCFASFGKEFVVLAAQRDIRGVNQMSQDQLKKVYNWCQMAQDHDGIAACIMSAVGSMYWGGENNKAVSISFCSSIPETSYQQSCFGNLIGNVSVFVKDTAYRQSFCKEVPDSFQKQCQEKLL